MDEKKETKEEEQPAEDTGKGDKPESTSLIEQANTTAERLEKANIRTQELLNKQEELMARQTFSGRADAVGKTIKPAELTPEEYANKALSGEL